MLIIAPLRVCYSVWPREIQKWDNFNELTWSIIHGPDKLSRLERDADIHIINPEGLAWLYDQKACRWRDWDVLCVDESTKFKDSQTKRFKLMRKHFERFDRRWILTGTPVPNGVHDLFGQIFILDLGNSLGRYVTHFRNKFFYTEAWKPYHYLLKDGAFEEIVDRIDALVMRMKDKDWLTMPELPPIDPIEVELPPKAREVYNELEEEFITKVEGGLILASNAAVAGGKLRQITNGAVYINDKHEWIELHSEKLGALSDLLEQLGGAPTLVMYEFQHDKERILKRLGSATPVIGGGTSAKRADEYITSFNKGHVPVMLCHPASMAHGLNLQDVCHHIIWYGIPWNYEYYDQSIRRIYRQGQANTVFVYHIVAKDTYDGIVMDALRGKEATQEAVFRRLTDASKEKESYKEKSY
jgi:SNF2 family DNA or RNA helicase